MPFSEHSIGNQDALLNAEASDAHPIDLFAERLQELEVSMQKLESQFGLQRGERAVVVNPARQELYVVQDREIQKMYTISTSAKGLGTAKGSGQTPIGTHRIAKKIGDNAPKGAVFKARKLTGHEVSEDEYTNGQAAPKTLTRLLWLSGLEPGVNTGEGIDTHERYIYIHGTNQEQRLGVPSSVGCIRMGNQEVIELYNLVHEGALVEIENKEYFPNKNSGTA